MPGWDDMFNQFGTMIAQAHPDWVASATQPATMSSGSTAPPPMPSTGTMPTPMSAPPSVPPVPMSAPTPPMPSYVPPSQNNPWDTLQAQLAASVGQSFGTQQQPIRMATGGPVSGTMPPGGGGALSGGPKPPPLAQEVQMAAMIVIDLFKKLQMLPGIDKNALQQAAMTMTHGLQMIAAAMPKQGPPPGGPSGGGMPMRPPMMPGVGMGAPPPAMPPQRPPMMPPGMPPR